MKQMGLQIAESMKQTPTYPQYASIAPRPQDWSVLLTELGELLRRDYDWSKEVAAIKTTTLIVVGDADSVRTAHAVAFFELLGGGKVDAGWDGPGMSTARLAILPGMAHCNIYPSPRLAAVVAAFLDAPMPGAKRPVSIHHQGNEHGSEPYLRGGSATRSSETSAMREMDGMAYEEYTMTTKELM